MTDPSCAIIVLNWNNADDTLACLDSIYELDYPAYSVLVVDNGSTDNSVSRVRTRYPQVEILETGANLGYAEGNNAGLRHVLPHHPDYVLLLNNDTLVAPSMLAELVRLAEAHPRAGMVGPTMYCLEPPDTLFATGSFVLWNQGSLWHRGMFEPAAGDEQVRPPEPVDFILGCGVLVRTQAIEAIGLFDTPYYMNFEDAEWGVRARSRGFEVWYAPQAILWHKVSATLGRASPANTYYMTRNALRFFWSTAPGHARWPAVTRILLSTLRTVGAWTLRSEYRSEIFRRKRDANLLAVRDFFLGRFGGMGPDVARVCHGE